MATPKSSHCNIKVKTKQAFRFHEMPVSYKKKMN